MNIIIKSSQGAEIHVTLRPDDMKLGTPYEVKPTDDDTSTLKVRMIDRQDHPNTTTYRFDLIAIVSRIVLTETPTHDT
jgi:hypothetical protein